MLRSRRLSGFCGGRNQGLTKVLFTVGRQRWKQGFGLAVQDHERVEIHGECLGIKPGALQVSPVVRWLGNGLSGMA